MACYKNRLVYDDWTEKYAFILGVEFRTDDTSVQSLVKSVNVMRGNLNTLNGCSLFIGMNELLMF